MFLIAVHIATIFGPIVGRRDVFFSLCDLYLIFPGHGGLSLTIIVIFEDLKGILVIIDAAIIQAMIGLNVFLTIRGD